MKKSNLNFESVLKNFGPILAMGIAAFPVACAKSTPQANVASQPAAAPAAPAQQTPQFPNAQCFSIAQAVQFSYQNATANYDANQNAPTSITIGRLFDGQAAASGTVQVTGAGMTTGTIQGQSADSSVFNLSLTLPNAPQQGPANGTGSIQLSAALQTQLAQQAASGQIPGLQGQTQQTLCISNVAVNGQGTRTGTNTIVFAGTVDLFLNQTDHGYRLNIAAPANLTAYNVSPQQNNQQNPSQIDPVTGTPGYMPYPQQNQNQHNPLHVRPGQFDIKPGRFKFKM